ncbi:hypothetical protein JET76_28640 [Pseudomonas putida]|uniref:hypothetical protein n=1 Tax=Pseudomonas putida TaxID=303 RepID=UPI0018E6B2B0|nr:hypothetical protein [Pseudomonas putida]MBI6945269.1 hypothetical protein [Pseudomonas putida]MBI6961583.1 hypothetical protein [Pseudomonas putida]
MNLTIQLIAAADDQSSKSPSIQNEYREFKSTLSDAGIKCSQRSMVFDSAAALGYPLGEFVIDFTTAVVPVLKVAIGAWFLARRGRKVKMVADGLVLEASTIEELEQLVALHQSIRDGRPHDPDLRRGSSDSNSGR